MQGDSMSGFSAGLAALEGWDVLWGRVIVPLRKNPTDYEWNLLGLMKGDFVTANCFCRRAILQNAGGFDERFFGGTGGAGRLGCPLGPGDRAITKKSDGL